MKKYCKWFMACMVIGLLCMFSTKAKAASDVVAIRDGIDVSGYSGDIDWAKVKAAGKKFVFIRCGYRGPNDDELCKDSYFEENLKGALDAGLDVGVYYVTQAITVAEAQEEAEETVKMVKAVLSQNSAYELTLPIVIDFEDEGNSTNRLAKANLSIQEHTNICKGFCNRVESYGFTAGFYAGKETLKSYVSQSALINSFPLWYAYYNSTLDRSAATFWQYEGNVTDVPGVSDKADLNRQYIRTPEKVSSISVSKTNSTTAKLTWSKVAGVYGYRVYRYSSATGKESCIGTVKGAAKTTYTDKSITSSAAYTYRVRAIIKTSDKIYYGACSDKVTFNNYTITYTTNGGTIKSGKVSKYQYGNTITLPTNVVRKGYLFAGWYTNKGFTSSKVTKITSTVYGNKTYYAKWTKVTVGKPVIKSVTNTSTKKAVVALKSKVSNADGYVIRYSTTSGMKSSKTVTITSATTLKKTISSLTKGKKYYFKVRAFRYDSTKAKVYGSYSAIKSVKITK